MHRLATACIAAVLCLSLTGCVGGSQSKAVRSDPQRQAPVPSGPQYTSLGTLPGEAMESKDGFLLVAGNGNALYGPDLKQRGWFPATGEVPLVSDTHLTGYGVLGIGQSASSGDKPGTTVLAMTDPETGRVVWELPFTGLDAPRLYGVSSAYALIQNSTMIQLVDLKNGTVVHQYPSTAAEHTNLYEHYWTTVTGANPVTTFHSLDTGNVVAPDQGVHNSDILVTYPDGDGLVVVGNNNDAVAIERLHDQKVVWRVEAPGGGNAVAAGVRTSVLHAAGDQGDVVVVDSATGKTIHHIKAADLPGCNADGFYLSDTLVALNCRQGNAKAVDVLQL